MDSISNGPVAEVLARLHREAEAADAPLARAYANEDTGGDEMIAQLIKAEANNLQEVYHGFAGNFLNVSPEFGRFLYMCARACKAKRIVEFGSSMGVSTIYMAAALRDTGGGRLIGTDLEPSKVERARIHLAAAGLADLVELRVGDARETLASGIDGDIDLLMLDGAFTLSRAALRFTPWARTAAMMSSYRRGFALRGSMRMGSSTRSVTRSLGLLASGWPCGMRTPNRCWARTTL